MCLRTALASIFYVQFWFPAGWRRDLLLVSPGRGRYAVLSVQKRLPFSALVFLRAGMSPELAGRRKLAKPMAYHVFRDVDRDELLAVMNRKRVSHKLGRDH